MTNTLCSIRCEILKETVIINLVQILYIAPCPAKKGLYQVVMKEKVRAFYISKNTYDEILNLINSINKEVLHA